MLFFDSWRSAKLLLSHLHPPANGNNTITFCDLAAVLLLHNGYHFLSEVHFVSLLFMLVSGKNPHSS